MKVAIACDHAGLLLKNELAEAMRAKPGSNLELEDLGTFSGDSVDYPDFATQVARRVAKGQAQLGVLICGTGIGMSIVANKVRGVRAAVCHTEFEARACRAHNDANVLCLGQRVTGPGVALAIVEAFLATPFEGGRHARRIQKITDTEEGR
jgi:ribose 5-phosphate isomerase B